MPDVRRPGLGARGQLLHREDVDVQPAHQVDDRRRDARGPCAGSRYAIRSRAPPGEAAGPLVPTPGQDGTGEDRPEPAAEQPLRSGLPPAPPPREEATADAAACGVNDIAGTSGKPRSVPVSRSAADAAHGTAAAVASRRRELPRAAIAVTVARSVSSGPCGGRRPARRRVPRLG